MALKIDPLANPLVTQQRAGQAPSATDFHQFAALRRAAEANDPKALREVARQFESIFTKMMLTSMREASFGDPLLGSDQVDMYQGMMDDQLAVSLSQGKGLGLADMLVRQLQTGAGPESASPASGNVTPEQQKEFVEGMLPHATAAARELGVDPRAIIAQAALETGWGTSQPADAGGKSNNYFGIKVGGTKAGAQWQGASVVDETTEFSAGQAGRESARFRAYGSVAESVADYVRVLRDPRYSAALGTGTDVRAFANALQRGGYATDPGYADKLVAIYGKLAPHGAARQEIAADASTSVNEFKSAELSPIDTLRTGNG